MKDTYSTPNGECIGYVMFNSAMPDTALVTGIRTFPKFRHKGYARYVLQQMLRDADAEGVTLYLSAQAEPWDNTAHPGLSQAQLEAWYTRYGFRSFIQDDQTQMVRK